MIIKESESEKGREGIVLNHSVGQHYVVEYVLIKSTHTHIVVREGKWDWEKMCEEEEEKREIVSIF